MGEWINPTSHVYQILWLQWGALNTSMGATDNICYLVYLGAHAKNQPEISKFEQDFRISKFCEIEIHVTLTNKKLT